MVYGVGISDPSSSGKQRVVWRDMLRRCYSHEYQEKNKTYSGCYVVDDWLNESAFGEWFSLNYVEGFELDKDLILPGNKCYGPDTCIFVPKHINSFCTSIQEKSSSLPVGCAWHSRMGLYQSYIRINGVKVHLGYYHSPNDAHNRWFEKKMSIAMSMKSEADAIHPDLHKWILRKIESMLKLM